MSLFDCVLHALSAFRPWRSRSGHNFFGCVTPAVGPPAATFPLEKARVEKAQVEKAQVEKARVEKARVEKARVEKAVSKEKTMRLGKLRRGSVAGAMVLLAVAHPVRADDKDPIDQALDRCLAIAKNQTTAGMVECTDAAVKAWDGRLNATYRQAMTALDARSAELLRSSQRQWLAFREAEHRVWGGPWRADQGTIMQMEILSAELGAIRERAEELQLYVPVK